MMTQTTTRELNQVALKAVKDSLRTRNKLQYELNKSFMTIDRWLKANSPKLAEGKALTIISEETGIPQDELISR